MTFRSRLRAGLRVNDAEEQKKEARLREAEVRIGWLEQRARLATGVLTERAQRNHWREAVEEMLKGARP